MICSDVRPLLDLLSDSELEKKDIALVFEHLDGCSECQSEWRAMERLQSLFKHVRENTPVPSSLIAKIDRRISASDRNMLRIRAIAASLLIAGLLSLIVLQNINSDRNSSTNAAALLAISNESIHPVSDLNQLPDRLGYEPKFVRLPGWKMRSVGVLNGNQSTSTKDDKTNNLARFTFSRNTGNAEQKLVCFQGRAGSIHYQAEKFRRETLADKSVMFSKQGPLSIALWSQNGRDYLFFSEMPEAELRKVVEQT